MIKETKTKKFEAPKALYVFAASVNNIAANQSTETIYTTISRASSYSPG